MKKKLLLLCFAACSLIAGAQPTPSTGTVPFTPGNLVIYRFNDEATAKNGIVPAFLDEITPTGELVRSIAMPTVANGTNRRFYGGLFNQLREGLMSLSADGRYLTVFGLDGPRNGTAYASYPKVIGRISGNGEVNTSTAIPTSNVGNVGRSVISKDGSGFYTIGGGIAATAPNDGRVRYVPFGFNAGVADASLASAPVVGGTNNGFAFSIFNDQLYYASQTTPGATLTGTIGTLGTGLPTPTADMDPMATYTALPLPAGLELPNQFVLLDTNADNVPDLLYVVEVKGANLDSHIRKYSYEGVDGAYQWYDMGSFTHAKLRDAKGIAARVVGSVAQLFINNAPAAGKPSIVRINDPITLAMSSTGFTVTQNTTDPAAANYKGIDEPGLVTTILYASLNYTFGGLTDGSTVNFRGIAFAPSPFTATGLSKEEMRARKFKAYLPVDNRLRLSLTSEVASSNAQVMVRDITGRVLFTQKVNVHKGENALQLAPYNYTGGVYVVTLVTGKEVSSLRFVK